MVFEVSEQSSVREVSKARGVVGHDVGFSWEVAELGTVAVVALVFSGSLAQVGSGARGGGGAFVESGDSGRVVTACKECQLGHVVAVADDVKVQDGGHLFQVAVRQSTVEVFVRHQVICDPGWQAGAPNAGRSFVGEEYPTKSMTTGVSGAHDGWVIGYELC